MLRHLTVLVPLVGCGPAAPPQSEPDAQGEDASARDATDSMPDAAGLPDHCTVHEPWSPGNLAFRNETDAWETNGIGAEGTRLSVGDVDGDGYPDLAVRRATGNPDDFAEGTRNNWLLRNTGARGFEDITEISGLWSPRAIDAAPRTSRGGQIVAFADVDNDGDLDAYVGLPATDPPSEETSELMLGDGSGHFALGPVESEIRLPLENASPAGASFVDFDRDGFVDLWIANNVGPGDWQPQPDVLARGDGTGAFADVSEAVNLSTSDWNSLDRLNAGLAHSRAWSAAACDLTGDGTTELLAGSYGRSPSMLWQATRDAEGQVHFENRSVASGYAFDEGTDWTDNESARCYCQLHRQARDCAEVPEPAYTRCRTDADILRWDHDIDRELFRLGGNMGATVCADVDNDRDIDLLTTAIVHWDVGSSSDPSELLLNQGEADVRFVRPGNEVTGLERPHEIPWDDGDITAAVFDFDNDGRPDILIASTDYPGTRALLFHQGQDGRFEPVPVDDGIDHTRAHGVAVADFDRDGDLDVVLGHSTARCAEDCYPSAEVRVYENVLPVGNWVQLELHGAEGTNASAIGARVELTADGVTQTHEVSGGYGHYGAQQDMTLHFGLADSCTASVSVRWPDAELSEQTFSVQAGYRYRVRQGERVEALGIDE